MKPMLYVSNRQEWRSWLDMNHAKEREIWLIYYRKHTDTPRIPYNDAVEEALCFGWIDSTLMGIDSDRYAQRFTPRNPRSSYSQLNKERLRRLIKLGKVRPNVLASVGDVAGEQYEFPPDIMAALRANKKAMNNFQKYSQAYQRIRVAYVAAARSRAGEFEKRLNHLLRMTEQDKQFGFGIEEYY